MDFSEVIGRRRMVRSYSDEPVTEGQIKRVIRAGLKAPSAGFTQGQSFVVVTETELRDKVAEIGGQAGYTAKGLSPWLSLAPAHIICCINPTAYRFRYKEPDKKGTPGADDEWPVPWWFIDAGCSMMALLLAAVNEGLSAGFLGFKTHAQEEMRGLLQIPNEIIPFGLITLGHACGAQPKGSAGRGRKPESEVVHWQRWDQG